VEEAKNIADSLQHRHATSLHACGSNTMHVS